MITSYTQVRTLSLSFFISVQQDVSFANIQNKFAAQNGVFQIFPSISASFVIFMKYVKISDF